VNLLGRLGGAEVVTQKVRRSLVVLQGHLQIDAVLTKIVISTGLGTQKQQTRWKARQDGRTAE